MKINGRGIFGQNKQKTLSGTYGGSRVLIEYQATPEKIHIIGPTTASVQIEVCRNHYLVLVKTVYFKIVYVKF